MYCSEESKMQGFYWIFAVLVLGGCARINDLGQAAFSSGSGAYAVVEGQLLEGEMRIYPDRTGLLTLREINPVEKIQGNSPSLPVAEVKSCQGRLRYSGTTSAIVNLRCQGAFESDVRMVLISETRGYGSGSGNTGPVSITFGLDPMQAGAHLIAPQGKQLVVKDGTLVLEAGN